MEVAARRGDLELRIEEIVVGENAQLMVKPRLKATCAQRNRRQRAGRCRSDGCLFSTFGP
ncbi:MAG: hypothetical protein R2911_17775 [Caldilineaceae bacterium]